MTPRQKVQQARFLRALALREIKLMRRVATERSRFVRQAASAYDEGHVPARVASKHADELYDILVKHLTVTAVEFGRASAGQVKSRSRREVKAALGTFAQRMAEWAATQALTRSNSIAATDFGEVRKTIQRALDEGLGEAEAAREIRGLTKLSASRAATIARTETHQAATYGSVEAVRDVSEELGIKMLKVWLPTLDDRTRPEHQAMAGADPVPLDEQFDVGGEMMDRPGDPSASPENTINCRCALAYEEAGD